MKALIPIKGSEDELQIERMLRVLPGTIKALVVLHVLDPSLEKALELVEIDHHRISRYRLDEVQKAQEAYAQQIIDRTINTVHRYSDIPTIGRILKGKPNEVILKAIEQEGAELVVLFAKERLSGPKSIGKIARFVLDHASCSVLLIRV